MTRTDVSPAVTYGVALLAVGTALGVRLALSPLLGGDSPFLLVVLAVCYFAGRAAWRKIAGTPAVESTAPADEIKPVAETGACKTSTKCLINCVSLTCVLMKN